VRKYSLIVAGLLIAFSVPGIILFTNFKKQSSPAVGIAVEKPRAREENLDRVGRQVSGQPRLVDDDEVETATEAEEEETAPGENQIITLTMPQPEEGRQFAADTGAPGSDESAEGAVEDAASQKPFNKKIRTLYPSTEQAHLESVGERVRSLSNMLDLDPGAARALTRVMVDHVGSVRDLVDEARVYGDEELDGSAVDALMQTTLKSMRSNSELGEGVTRVVERIFYGLTRDPDSPMDPSQAQIIGVTELQNLLQEQQ